MKKRHLLPFLLLSLLLPSCNKISLPNDSYFSSSKEVSSQHEVSNSTSSKPDIKKLPAVKLFDIDKDLDNLLLPQDGLSFKLEEYENKTLTVTHDYVVYFDGKAFAGVRSAYLYDVDNDGYRDLCSTHVNGSGYWSWSAHVYKLTTGVQIFYMHERMNFDYFFEIRDDVLILQKCEPYTSVSNFNVVSEGTFKYNFETKTVEITWINPCEIEAIDITISLASYNMPRVTTKIKDDKISFSMQLYNFYYFDFGIITNDFNALPDFDCISFPYIVEEKSPLNIAFVGKIANVYRYYVYALTCTDSNPINLRASLYNFSIDFSIQVASNSNPLRMKNVFDWAKNLEANDISKIKWIRGNGDDTGTYLKKFILGYCTGGIIDNFNLFIDYLNTPIFEIGCNLPFEGICSLSKYTITLNNGETYRISMFHDFALVFECNGTYYAINSLFIGENLYPIYCYTNPPKKADIRRVEDNTKVCEIDNLEDYEFFATYEAATGIDFETSSEYYIDVEPRMYICENGNLFVKEQRNIFNTGTSFLFDFLYK